MNFKFNIGLKFNTISLFSFKLQNFIWFPFLPIKEKLPSGQIYVLGIFVEHSHEIFPIYSDKFWGIFRNNVPGILNIENTGLKESYLSMPQHDKYISKTNLLSKLQNVLKNFIFFLLFVI